MKRIIFLSVIISAVAVSRISAQITAASITPSSSLTVGTLLNTGYTGTIGGTSTVKFSWFLSDNTDLNVVSDTYTVRPTEEGKAFYVKAQEYDSGNNPVGSPIQSPNTGTVNYMPVASSVAINGTSNVGSILDGSYSYTDAESDPESGTKFRWYRSDTDNLTDTVLISGASSDYYLLTNTEYNKYVAFAVKPVSSQGSKTGILKVSSFTAKVTNAPPLASSVSITGPPNLNVNDILIGSYVYSDNEGDQEEGSDYQWLRSPDNNIANGTVIPSASAIFYQLQLADTGKFIFFRVTPEAKTGNITGNQAESGAAGPVNTPPYATSVGITGLMLVGETLTGTYQYGDHDGDDQDLDGTIYRWFRDGVQIDSAFSLTYKITEDDEGKKLKFQVTPVSESGYPDTGLPVEYEWPTAVPASATLPVVYNLCIDGIRKAGNTITGKYSYINTSRDTRFKFRWMRDNDTIPGAISKTFLLAPGDINRDISFVVYPISKSGLRRGLTEKSYSLARILMIKDAFFSTDPDTLLTGSPTGGDFFGDGVINSKFSPQSLTPRSDPYTIKYQKTYSYSKYTCQQTHPKEVTIQGVTMYYEGLDPSYCTNGSFDTIYVRDIPPGATSFRFGMTGPNAIVYQAGDMVVIDPGLMREGYNLDYLYFQCNVFLSPILYYKPLVVYSAPAILVEGLKENQIICSSVGEFQLIPTPAGGIFSGNPIKNTDIFDPALGNRYDTVAYTYTAATGCVSERRYPVVINPAPVVDFDVADVCITDPSDSTVFINNTTSADPFQGWKWEFFEFGGSQTDTALAPKHLYKLGGTHIVSLTSTTVNDCAATRQKTLDLGNKPEADFYWVKECLAPSGNNDLHLLDRADYQSAIDSTIWIFPNGAVARYKGLYTDTVKYQKTVPGYMNITYLVKTRYLDCHDTITRNIYIRPTIAVPSDGYIENFESGNGSWVPYDLNNKIWSFGTPNRPSINKASSGVNAWYTSYPLAGQKKDSASIISPCFDFQGVERPMIKLMLWKRFDRERDGAVLQYKIGDEPGWNYVGTIDDGINWFNSALIKGKPGDGTLGWTAGSGNSKDGAYIESSNKLDSLSGKKDVKFRISYGSDGTSVLNDGIAFDSIWIGSRTRGVLLEHFTNNSSSASVAPTSTVSNLSNRWTDDVINIQYHTNFPGADIYFDSNPADASARFLFYGLSKVPYTFIDGGTDNPNFASLFDYNLVPFDSSRIYKRSMVNPLFRINITATISSGKTLHVSGTIKALKAINAENLTLFIAVTQKKSTDTRSGKQYYNVFRKFIPDAGGITMPKTMAINELFTLSERTWNYSNFDNSDMEVIVFVQNNITKAVYQAESVIKPDNIVGIENTITGGGIDFSIWPNPSAGKLTIGFSKPPDSPADIMIYDFSGTLVRTYKAATGDPEYIIDDHGLKSGIYLLRISCGGVVRGHGKFIVSGR